MGGEEEEMRLDGWLKLSEITTDPLQQVENTTRISGDLGCMAECRPWLCSQWREFFSFTFILFISVSKHFKRGGEKKKFRRQIRTP